MSPIVQFITVFVVVATILSSPLVFDGWTSPDAQFEALTPDVSLATSHPLANSVPVESCRELDAPGRYHLAGDLVSHTYTCLEITADDVVLDGRGHTVTVAQSARELGHRLAMPTPDYFGEAVLVADSRSNVTVTSLSFEGFDVGIRSVGGSGLVVTDVVGADSVTAIYVDGVDDVLLRAVTVRGSAEDGLVVANATNVALDGVTVDSSYFAGIAVYDSHQITIDSTTVSRNHGDGLFVYDGSGVLATGLNASENAVGALVIGADGTMIRSSTFDRNHIAGVAVGRATGVILTDSAIRGTVGDPGVVGIEQTAGLLALEASDVTLRDVVVVENQKWSVVAADSSSVVLDRVSTGSTVISLVVSDTHLDLDSTADRYGGVFKRGTMVEDL